MEADQQDLQLARWQLAPCVATACMSSMCSIRGSSSLRRSASLAAPGYLSRPPVVHARLSAIPPPSILIHMPTCTRPVCPETRHEMEADGDGHEFPGGRAALRRPARRLLRQARPSWLAAPALLRGVAGTRPAAAGPRARGRADYRCSGLLSQRERAVRDQRAVSPRYLD